MVFDSFNPRSASDLMPTPDVGCYQCDPTLPLPEPVREQLPGGLLSDGCPKCGGPLTHLDRLSPSIICAKCLSEESAVADGSLAVATPEPVNQLLLNLAYEYRDMLRSGPNDEATRARIARCDEAIAKGRE